MCLAEYQLATILFHGLFKKYVTFCGGRREGVVWQTHVTWCRQVEKTDSHITTLIICNYCNISNFFKSLYNTWSIIYLIQMKFSSLSQYFLIYFACQTITLINILNNILEKSVIYNTVCAWGGGGMLAQSHVNFLRGVRGCQILAKRPSHIL